MFESIIGHQARQNPAGLAIVTGAGSVTFLQLEADIRRISAALREIRGLKGRVAVQVSNLALHWLVLLALTRLGHVTVSLPAAGTGDDAALLAIIKPDVLVSDVGGEWDGIRTVHLSAGWVQAAMVRAPETVPAVPLGAERLVRIVLSSGTSGPPKLIGLTRSQLDQRLINLRQFGHHGHRCLILGVGIDNSAGFLLTLERWAQGGQVVYPAPGFAWSATLQDHLPDTIVMAPVQLDLLLRSLPEGFARRDDLHVGAAGGGLSRDLARRARAALSPHIHMTYGSTEAGLVATGPSTLTESAEGAAGYAYPGVAIQIVDDDRQPLEPGQVGEIRVRGSEVLGRYVDGSPMKDPDGWHYTGDVGSLSSDGLLVVDGRKADIIGWQGAAVIPLTIETVVLGCPGVLDAAAFPMPTSSGLSMPFVAVRVDDAFDAPATQAALLARWPEMPVQIAPVREIPRNARGKIQRSVLRDRIILGITEIQGRS